MRERHHNDNVAFGIKAMKSMGYLIDDPGPAIGHSSLRDINTGDDNIAIIGNGLRALGYHAGFEVMEGLDPYMDPFVCPHPERKKNSRWACRYCEHVDLCKPKDGTSVGARR